MGLFDLILHSRQQRELDQQHSSLIRTSDRAEDALRRVADLEARVDALAVGLDVALDLLARHAGMSDDQLRAALAAGLADAESRQWSTCVGCHRKNRAARTDCLYCGEPLGTSSSTTPHSQ